MNSSASAPKVLEEAITRLTAALQSFEDAVAQRLKKEQKVEDLQQRIHSLSSEHERLVASLVIVRQRADRLESANDEVSKRLKTAIESIRIIAKAG